MENFIEEFSFFSLDAETEVEKVCIPRHSLSKKEIGYEARGVFQEIKTKENTDPSHKYNPYLMGLREQLETLYSQPNVILVEGFFDMFSVLRVVDRKKVSVFSIGGLLYSEIVAEFFKLTQSYVYLALDNDSRGQKNLKNGMYMFRQHKVPYQKLEYVGGKDFNEVFQKRGDDGLRRNLITFL